MTAVFPINEILKRRFENQGIILNPLYRSMQQRRKIYASFAKGILLAALLFLGAAYASLNYTFFYGYLYGFLLYCLMVITVISFSGWSRFQANTLFRQDKIQDEKITLTKVQGQDMLIYEFAGGSEKAGNCRCTMRIPLHTIRHLYLYAVQQAIIIEGDISVQISFNGKIQSLSLPFLKLYLDMEHPEQLLNSLSQRSGRSFERPVSFCCPNQSDAPLPAASRA